MRIAQVAPLFESVPPKGYGGTERVVSWLTEELVRRGHQVTLFASGDSETTAELVSCVPRGLRSNGDVIDSFAWQVCQLEDVARRADGFDLIHYHVDYLHFPLTARRATPTLTTLHGRLDLPDLLPIYERFPGVPLVSISDAQRWPLPWVAWRGTVHHGLPRELFRFEPRRGDYLAFLGRISPEKRADRAIEIARRAGMPLKIAAKVDRADRDYHETTIAPLLDQPHIEFLGEIGESDKQAFLGGAAALLFPIDWPEPFGLVMIEALACGTPVVAFARGSVPEVIEHGRTGFVVDDVDAAVAAVAELDGIDRSTCRRRFEERFSVEAMTDAYERLYAAEAAAGSAEQRLTA